MIPGSKPCRSCGAPVIWATTPAGRRIPLDAAPHSAGTIVLRSDGIAVVSPAGDPPRYQPHFATCPQGKTWSKKGSAR